MPEPVALFGMEKRQVEIGPRMALVTMAGSQMTGLRMIFGICSMEVPSPCAASPPIPFSRKEATAKPIMFEAQPTAAAPAAMPLKFKEIPMAAELMGSVRAIPMRTDTMIPAQKGCWTAPQLISSPIRVIKAEIGTPTESPAAAPTQRVVIGVTRISTLVFPATSPPSSTAR